LSLIVGVPSKLQADGPGSGAESKGEGEDGAASVIKVIESAAAMP